MHSQQYEWFVNKVNLQIVNISNYLDRDVNLLPRKQIAFSPRKQRCPMIIDSRVFKESSPKSSFMIELSSVLYSPTKRTLFVSEGISVSEVVGRRRNSWMDC